MPRSKQRKPCVHTWHTWAMREGCAPFCHCSYMVIASWRAEAICSRSLGRTEDNLGFEPPFLIEDNSERSSSGADLRPTPFFNLCKTKMVPGWGEEEGRILVCFLHPQLAALGELPSSHCHTLGKYTHVCVLKQAWGDGWWSRGNCYIPSNCSSESRKLQTECFAHIFNKYHLNKIIKGC